MSDKNKNRKKKQSLRIYEVPSYLKYFYLLKRNTFYKNKHVLLMKIHIHKSVLCTYNQEHLVIRSVSKAIYLLDSLPFTKKSVFLLTQNRCPLVHKILILKTVISVHANECIVTP